MKRLKCLRQKKGLTVREWQRKGLNANREKTKERQKEMENGNRCPAHTHKAHQYLVQRHTNPRKNKGS